MSDARFEDGVDKPLRLKALDLEDLQVISALAQDAVVPVAEMGFDGAKRRFALLINRFRWEDAPAAQERSRDVERTQALLFVDDVLSVQSSGFDKAQSDLVMSLLSVSFLPGKDGMGQVHLVFAGDGEVMVSVEALEVGLQDVTKPYIAPSGKTPNHD